MLTTIYVDPSLYNQLIAERQARDEQQGYAARVRRLFSSRADTQAVTDTDTDTDTDEGIVVADILNGTATFADVNGATSVDIGLRNLKALAFAVVASIKHPSDETEVVMREFTDLAARVGRSTERGAVLAFAAMQYAAARV